MANNTLAGRSGGRRKDGNGGGPMRRHTDRWSNNSNPYSKCNVNSRAAKQQFRGRLSNTSIRKIIISNLDEGVSTADMRRLFEEFGPLKSVSVHYDSLGRSLGTAEIVFDSKDSLLRACRRYHSVPLNGRPMRIELASDMPTAVQNVEIRPGIPITIKENQGSHTARRSAHYGPYSKCVINEGLKKQSSSSGNLSTNDISKIVISNLDYRVTSTDIQDLFEEFGQLKSASVRYDGSGNSLGTAEVVFDNTIAAINACSRYHGITLDGCPMWIELVMDSET